MLVKVITSTLLALSFSFVANASIVNIDWKTEGDNKAFLDTTTGLEWLDLTQSKGYSINGAKAELGSNGEFKGFRVATFEEVYGLFDTMKSETRKKVRSPTYRGELLYDFRWTSGGEMLGYTGSSCSGSKCTLYRRAMDYAGYLLGVVGRTNTSSGNAHYTYGLAETSSGGTRLTSIGQQRVRGSAIYLKHNMYTYDNTSYSNANYGVYLVSDGGNTLSSKLNPELMINNLNAPINNVSASSMSLVTASLALCSFLFAGMGFRRKS